MTRDRWERIDVIFAEAVDLPPEKVCAYLDAACGEDSELRLEVDRLLESDRQAQGRLSDAVGVAAAAFSAQMQSDYSASQIGQRIGPYEIVREIGRGGMGSVYHAVRIDDQYIRSVAVKFIAQGMDTRDALARFRTERQILATLQHPNIAGLLDGGTTQDGRPYIVMEYIEGAPLLDYCRKNNLSIDARLSLFCALCSAVHHAHQMLVIHRDIKPGNVLVTGEGVPKLLDFGIAKLLATGLVADDASTQTIMRPLTPQYASPEQIRGESLTTATDIYSLGVLLYELLTYQPPYPLTGLTSPEVERLVCGSEPLRLSLAARKDARLRRQLSGDLETIVGMALRKEPLRRYSSAQQFAHDVQKYRDGLPVSAREDTIVYLASKMVRRNSLASAAFAMLALSIAAGWFATYQQARRTQGSLEEVRKLANTVLYQLHSKIEHLPGATPARELLVHTALQYLNNVSAYGGGGPDLQWELGQAYEFVGDVQGDPSGPNLGQFREARTSYDKALSLVEPLTAKVHDYRTLSCASWLFYKRGDLELRDIGPEAAVASYLRGLEHVQDIDEHIHDPRRHDLYVNGYLRLSEARSRMGLLKLALEDARKAEWAADRAAASRKDGGIANLAKSRLMVGNLLWRQGDLPGAWLRHSQAVEWLEKRVADDASKVSHLEDLADAYRRCGDLQGNPAFFHFGDVEKATMYHNKALRIAEQLAIRDPQDAQALAQLSVALRRTAAITGAADPAAAAQLCRRGLETLQKLLEGSPNDQNYLREVASTRAALASALRASRRYKPALEQMTTAISIQKQVIASKPQRLPVRQDMFDTLLALGSLQLEMSDTEGARVSFQEALESAETMFTHNATSLYSERCLSLAYQHMAQYHAWLYGNGRRLGRAQHAALANEWYDKAAAVWTRWRHHHLAVPFATHREKEILRQRAHLPVLSTKL